MGIKKLIKGILEEKENRDYRQRLKQKKMSYGEWAASAEAGQEERKEWADVSFVVFRAGKGRLASGAYEAIGSFLASRPEVQLLYGDEDVWAGTGDGADRESPWYKPDWSPELLDSFFYFGSVVALRREFLDRTSVRPEAFCVRRKEDDYVNVVCWEVEDFAAFERAVHDLAEQAGGYEKASGSIGHVPEILFHGESRKEQDRFLEPSSCPESRKAQGRKRFRGSALPLLSVIVPSKDHPEALESCLKNCLSSAEAEDGGRGLSVEILIVDNGSSAENRERIGKMIRRLEKERGDTCHIRYLYRPEEFNFSRMCNRGAAEAAGELLLFLNDDVELCRPGALESLAAMAAGSGIGAVGLKLYYPGSRRIQHAGITNLPIGPVHKLQFLEDDSGYYYGASRGNHNVLAVTAACLMVRKDRYQEVGGFPEDLQVAFNDVDFCFCLYEAGYRNVCMNDIWAYHHESLSRGDDESEGKIRRLDRERERLYERHPGLEGIDPYYSALLNREYLDTGIRPGFLTAGNRMQRVAASLEEVAAGAGTGNGTGPQISKLPWESGMVRSGYRQDECVLIRIEDCRRHRAFGYGVVLGDDNACYHRALLLWETGKRETGAQDSGKIYAIRLEGMYRPDLEENMPDQKNVALCGFDVELEQEAIPEGRYRVGMAVRNRITGLRLLNWSNRFLEVGQGVKDGRDGLQRGL